MVWCLTSMALMFVVLALIALKGRPPYPHMPRLRPMTLLRGCVALLCLLVALGLGMGAIVAMWW